MVLVHQWNHFPNLNILFDTNAVPRDMNARIKVPYYFKGLSKALWERRNPLVTTWLSPWRYQGSLGALHKDHPWSSSNFLENISVTSPVFLSFFSRIQGLVAASTLVKNSWIESEISFFLITSQSSNSTFSTRVSEYPKDFTTASISKLLLVVP